MGTGRILKSLAVLLGPGLVLTSAASPAPEVEIANGTIRGGRCAFSPVNYFLSIPYAVPPVGNLRFTPPQPYNQTFAGVRDATTPAPSCPQLGAFFVAYQAGQSEDWYVSRCCPSPLKLLPSLTKLAACLLMSGPRKMPPRIRSCQ